MNRWTFWTILIVILVSIWVSLPTVSAIPDTVTVFGQSLHLGSISPQVKSFLLGSTGRYPIKLGLDLQGGTELILQTDMSLIKDEDKDNALESSRGVIERRVNLFGVSESVVQSSKVGDQRRILVELPGIKDASQAASLVGKTALLEFREIDTTVPQDATDSAILALLNAKPSGLTGADLKKAQVTFGSGQNIQSSPQVAIEFTEGGAQKFAEITKRNLGRALPIFLDGEPISAPVVQQEIIGGSAVISGNFSTEEAKNLSIQLNAGALPVPIKILEQRTIGATLGEESIQKSVIAGVIGVVIIMIFMAVYYGILGLIADLALLIYILVTIAVMRTGLFVIPPVTLTLAGIAGFILSIGMAVDANILIFERIKEENREGKHGRTALKLGFTRAWSSIRDSNLSSLITATILFMFGTSVVRGFALTLALGVLVSMFSAITVTKSLLQFLPRFRK
jgi:preprotein translocase subunit SecD